MLNTARIAKNTIFLYLRMILVLVANFLAVRVLLEVLGVDDYGLFNLIVGFVTLFTLLNIVLERRVFPTLPTLPLLELVLVTPVNLLFMLFIGCTSFERAFLRQKLAAKLHRNGGS